MNLRVTRTEVAGTRVVELTGPVDLATLPSLQSALTGAIVEHPGTTIAVDLDGVDSLDDAGLGILLGAAAHARRRGGDLVVVCSRDGLRARFALAGFDRAIDVRSSLPA